MSSIFQGSTYSNDQIRALLQQAQEAYHQLMTGTKAVSVERQGRKVTYTQADKKDLRLYIQDLQATLQVSDGRGRQPAGMCF